MNIFSGSLLLLLLAIVVYFIPVLVAGFRDHQNRLAILMLNLFLGWTLLGWVVALVWACMSTQSAVDARACPQCAEPIRREAKKCRHCGANVEPMPPAGARETVTYQPPRQTTVP